MNPVEAAVSLQPLVRDFADQNEAQRHLAPEIARAFCQHGLYRIAAPEDAYGSAHDPITQMRTSDLFCGFGYGRRHRHGLTHDRRLRLEPCDFSL